LGIASAPASHTSKSPSAANRLSPGKAPISAAASAGSGAGGSGSWAVKDPRDDRAGKRGGSGRRHRVR
jgi:hypothetical protein